MAEELRKARMQARMGVQQAALALGMDVSTLWRYETGHRHPDDHMVAHMAKVYGCRDLLVAWIEATECWRQIACGKEVA